VITLICDPSVPTLVGPSDGLLRGDDDLGNNRVLLWPLARGLVS